MKPLLLVALCLTAALASPDNIEQVKELPQSKEPLIEAEESEPQSRAERCTTCGGFNLGFKSPNAVLAQIQAIPGAEIHTQQSFEGCSSDKGCAGIKVKDGRVIERFGNFDSFKAAAAADSGNEFQFHPAGSNVFEGGIPNAGPYWWMNQDSPFKNTAAAGGAGSFKKFSESSSFTSSGGAGAGGAGGAGFDIASNPFLNGEFSKTAGGFAAGQEIKPQSFQSSSFESSSFSTSGKGGEVDISKNPFLNGGFKNTGAASGYQASSSFSGNGFGQNQGFGAGGAQSNFASGNKFTGYTGSSPSPFTASTAGNNVNLIQSSQKANEFDFEQQQQTQQNIDEIFQGTGNVHAHEHSGGELQQTCAGQGYTCVHKAQCNNGVVNTNGAGLLQAKTKKQYCNTKTEICCRIEISTLTGAGGLQGSLGVGSATFQGAGSQGTGLFVSGGQGSSQSGSSQSGSSFGQSGFASQAGQAGIAGQSGQAGQAGFAGQAGQAGIAGQAGQAGIAGQAGQSSFESSSSSFGSSTFGSRGSGTQGFGAQGAQGQSGFGAQGTQGQSGFGAQGTQGLSGFGATASGASFGANNGGAFGANGVNKGVSVESSSFESTNTQRGSTGGFGNGNNFGAAGTFGSNGANGFGSTLAPAGGAGSTVYKTTSQTNFIETDSFSSGSENQGVFRQTGTGLKPGIPYLPPADSSNSASGVSQTSFTTVSTGRPFTPKPTYLPPVTSTAAPGYLPPEIPEQTINTETRVPQPTYSEGGILLDVNRQPPRKPIGPLNNEIPAGCAAALKCTPIEYCTAEGVISNTTVALSRDQDAFRVPLTDCKDLETGRVGKCCRDPFYTDPWPTNQLGKWVQGVFGGNDGKYTPDSRGSGSISRPQVTARPPVTGAAFLNNFRTPKPTVTPFGPNQVTPGFGSTTSQGAYGQKGQFEIRGQGQYAQGGQGQFAQGGQGQFAQGGLGQVGVAQQGAQGQAGFGQSSFSTTQSQYSSGSSILGANQGAGQGVGQGQGQITTQGQGQFVQQGAGGFAQGGRGQFATGGVGQLEIQGQGAQGSQGQFSQTSSTQKGFGQTVVSEQGLGVSQGFGTGVKQGAGFGVSQGAGFQVENDYSESVNRVFLAQYQAGAQCGLLNGQKPYGNRNENEVDFAEIPWQAMVLLQTNKSLLCGGVITRPDVVVTSAACVDGLDAKNVLIKGGEWKLGIDDEPLPFQIVQVKNILRHPFYKRGSLNFDVAILVLSENLRFNKNIYPICVPRAGETLDAFYNGAGECVVTGWGKQVLQAHIAGAIMHSVNVSLINPGECQAKLQADYPHLLEQYDQESCACGQPTNPVNNICTVDIGSALACTTDSQHFVLRGVYSWDSGCQPGNQLAAFYKFDIEWYEWAIGLLESARFAQFSSGAQILGQNRFAGQIKGQAVKGGASSFVARGSATKGGAFGAQGFGAQGTQGFGVKGAQGFGAQGTQGFGVKGAQGFGAQGTQGFGVKGAQGFGAQGAQGFGSQGVQDFGVKGTQGFGSQGVQGFGVKGTQGFGAQSVQGFGAQGTQGFGAQGAQGFGAQGAQGFGAQGAQGFGAQGAQGFGAQGFSKGFSQFSSSQASAAGGGFGAQIKAPVTNSFSASYTEKKVFQSEPKIITYTTKPEIVTFTTKPEFFTFTTKPKLVTYTTKPQIIRYETSGSGTNPQYVAPGVTFNPSFTDVVGAASHKHTATCQCEGK